MDVNDTQFISPSPVAIISVGCFFPHASGSKAFWHLLYHGKDAISDVPPTHWSPEDYYTEDTDKLDHVYCRRGGFLSPIPFDPTMFGIPPSNLEATDSSQILALLAAKAALDQAGYGDGADFDRDRTAVILGVTGTQELVIPLSTRLSWPKWKRALEACGVGPEKTDAVMAQLSSEFVGWQENSFPGLLGNVVAGRICNRLDLGGTNCAVDAACASSMSAISLALMELYTGRSRMVVTGGVDTLNDIFMHMCFARTHILSPTGDARPFSAKADGTVLGEGIGILIMKRLADAEADGDKILAVLKGIGSSSDGRSQSIYAPRAEGQLSALRRAYSAAAITPDTIGLIEAHGTGTRVGDKIEVQALKQLLEDTDTPRPCALGSVKSMIGHTKAAAGAAGLIKTVLALQNKVLPPTLKADAPDPDLGLGKSPFYVNSQARPWFRSNDTPRRAGVSAFGFGGSNYHVVLEEYGAQRADVAWDGSIEIVALSADTREALDSLFQSMRHKLSECPPDELPYLARESRSTFEAEAPYRLVMVFTRTEDTQGPVWDTDSVLEVTAQALESNSDETAWQTPSSFYGRGTRPGRVAFLFPGQGSQYLHMGRDLVTWFPEAMEALESAAQAHVAEQPLTDRIYPLFSETHNSRQCEEALRHTAVAQPAIGGISVAMEKILRRFGLAPDATCGHSYGELTALYSAGWIDEDTLHQLSSLRGRLMAEAGGRPGEPNGAMLAVKAPLDDLDRLLEAENLDVVLANRNSPRQGILSGDVESIERAEAVCKTHKYRTVRLPVSAAFHSRLVESAREPFAAALQSIALHPGTTPVYSNTTGEPYPTDVDAIRTLLGNHLRNPVNFVAEIETLYNHGGRIFIEVGPKTVLTGLVRTILKGRSCHALAMDASNGKNFAIADLARLLSQLAALGCPIRWDEWESQEDPPPKLKMRIPIAGANYRAPKPESKPRLTKARPSTATGNTRLANSPAAVSHRPETSMVSSLPTNLGEDNLTEKPTAATPGSPKQYESSSVSDQNHPLLQALKVVQQGLESLQSLQAQTVEAHQKFLDTQQQAGRTLQEMMESSRRFAETALGGSFAPAPEIPTTMPAVAAAALTPERPDAAPVSHPSPNRNPIAPSATLPHQPPSAPEAESFPPQPSKTPVMDVDANRVAQTLLEVVSELTGYPADMLGMDMHIESDLGIDSIKRVEILSQIEEKLEALPPITPDIIAEFQTLGQVAAYLAGRPADQAGMTEENHTRPPEPSEKTGLHTDIVNALLGVVSELTGYPIEMLNLDMDVEGDLGIDSIKRVEILSALEDRLADFPSIAPDEMAELKTLGQIAARLGTNASNAVPPAGSPIETPLQPKSAGNPRDAVQAALLTVVSELTGYPEDMLSGDMDIEADLGIDSIKRVEILSAMEDRLPLLPAIAPDDMAGLKTLAQIAAILAGGETASETIDPEPEQPVTTPPQAVPLSKSEAPAAGLQRRELVAVETPRAAAPVLAIPPDRKIFITTDKAGLSHALADQLAAKGLHTVQISIDILKHRDALPDAAGLILLCDTEYPVDAAQDHPKHYIADAFELTRHLGNALQASAREGGAILTSISRMDGTFGVDGLNGQHPYPGGLAGLVKTAAIEWPEVTCRALDIDAGWQDNPAIARKIVAELLQPVPHAPVEVGWQRDRRITLALHPAPLDDRTEPSPGLEDGDVVVLTGGARGVTAAAAETLARQRALNLVLLGRSSMPFDEPAWLQGLETEADIKKAIIANDFAAVPPTPQAVQKAYRRYRSNREISANLARIRATGAEARYFSLDVRDADKVRAVLNDVRLVHGPIKALVHGAGILRDKRILDKTSEEFQQVFDTKVQGLENLLAATREDPLRYIILFSSVAARFGNIGQVDYAVANEVLNKVAVAEAARRKDCTVRAINWGPWDGGMVDASLKKSFQAKKIPLIPVEQGAAAFLEEMTAGRREAVEVVIGSELPSGAATVSNRFAPPENPGTPDDKPVRGLSTAYLSELSLERYPILDHHRLDTKPVVPFALMAEWFGHGALHNNPGLQLAGFDDMRLLKGIVLEDRQRPIRVLAAPATSGPKGIAVKLELRDGLVDGAEVVHAKSTANLAETLPTPPPFEIPVNLLNAGYRRDVAQIYTDILFHGQDLQGIRQILACTPEGMLAELDTAPAPSAWIQKPPRNHWIADPLVLDCAFQMASLWCYEETGCVSLPSYSASYRQYCRRFPSHPVQAVLSVQDVSRHKFVGNVTFLDQNGSVLAQITGYEAVMEDRLIQAFKPERYASGR